VRYRTGFKVSISPPGAASWAAVDDATIAVTFEASQLEDVIIAVTIAPA
jgi:hypothetical protein